MLNSEGIEVMKMLTVRVLQVMGVKLGYCNHCNLPRIVAVCRLSGWEHEFSICENCLEGLIKTIREGSKKLNKSVREGESPDEP